MFHTNLIALSTLFSGEGLVVSIHTLISGEGWRPPCPPQNYHVSVGVYLEALIFSSPVP